MAQFVALRVLHPETDFWRSGLAAAARYVKEVAESGELRVPYDYVTPVGHSVEGRAVIVEVVEAGARAISGARTRPGPGMIGSCARPGFSSSSSCCRTGAG